MNKADMHSKKGMISFKEGTSILDLMDFYNHQDFKKGKPVYDPRRNIIGSNLEMLDAGVIFLSVPHQVRRHLDPSGLENLEKIGVATDALITLSCLDNLVETRQEFYKAALTRMVGGKTSYYSYVKNYLGFFEQLLMIKTTLNLPSKTPHITLTDWRFLTRYEAVGIVPAPLMDTSGIIDKKIISLNIPHIECLTPPVGRIEYASHDAVKKLYAPLVKQ
jgi:hypothetical protein